MRARRSPRRGLPAAPLNRLARLLAIAHGGQILLTEAVEQLVQDDLPSGASLRDLGKRLRDLVRTGTRLHPDPGSPRRSPDAAITG